MTKGKAVLGASAASLALLALGKAAFVREIPSAQAQDVSRAWFMIAVLLICAVLFLISRARSTR